MPSGLNNGSSGLGSGALGLGSGASGLWSGSTGLQGGSVRLWAPFTVSAGWAESPPLTYTRNTAGSWTPRIYSNLVSGAVKMEGKYISGSDQCFGLDPTPVTSLTFNTLYAWYFSPTAGTRLAGVPRVAVGAVVAGDTYGVRKIADGANWTVEWYRVRSGVTTIHDTLVVVGDVALTVLAGSFQDTSSLSLSQAN